MTHNFISLDFFTFFLDIFRGKTKYMSEEADYRPRQKLADIRKTMAENNKEKNHVEWVNKEIIVTDSEDEADASKSTVQSDDGERYFRKIYLFFYFYFLVITHQL